MKKILICFLAAGLLISCGQQSAETKRLQAENDSLKLENAKNATQMDEMLDILNDIENDFQSIRDAENYLTLKQQDVEFSVSTRDEIRRNMQFIRETLQKNRDQISQLEDKLNKSNIQSESLRKTLRRLSSELEQKNNTIIALQEDLARKNIRIQELDEQLANMGEEMEGLSVTNMAQSERLQQQDQAIHTAYYCFGTARELKDQNILSGGGLLSKSKLLQDGFNQDYFISVDTRELREIPLFANKAKLLSTHPQGSYEFIKDEDKNLTFVITDYQAFWSMGKYLVIEVDL